MKNYIITLVFVLFLFSINGTMNAHCDTMDGPVVADAKKALETNNINYILKWVFPDAEAEIKQSFELTMKVRK
ncbi:MAG TPA: DUF6448 family protein, partial [Bacteroidales bacterium]|nr:DUF6448 family protein [Bacteroidales bacterium]